MRFAAEVSAGAAARVVERLRSGDVGRAGSALSGDAARLYGELTDACQRDPEPPSPDELALVLMAAVRTVVHERARQRVELVWSGPSTVSSTLRSTGPALLELISEARQSVYIVTFAAYKVPTVADALADAVKRGVRVVFVLESDSVSGGKVDFNPLPHLLGDLATGAEVYVWPQDKRQRDSRGRHGSLHAKFAVADRRRLLVSSANLTEYAFTLNIELGTMVTGGSSPLDASRHIDELIRTGILVRLAL